jgi:excisionase family DNA binding protein
VRRKRAANDDAMRKARTVGDAELLAGQGGLTIPADRGLEELIRAVVRTELAESGLLVSASGSSSFGPRERSTLRDAAPTAQNAGSPAGASEVMTADQVAAFLGVDRNTVYDYAARGTIPHRRLGKRMLFHRGALVAWLDPCKAASARKG